MVLCLSRKINESIIIGDDIRVMVLEIRGDKVRIGIDADKSITVHREEVSLAIQREKFLAENPVPPPVAEASCDAD